MLLENVAISPPPTPQKRGKRSFSLPPRPSWHLLLCHNFKKGLQDIVIYSSPSFPPLDFGLRPKRGGNKGAAVRSLLQGRSAHPLDRCPPDAAIWGAGGTGADKAGQGCAPHPPLHGPALRVMKDPLVLDTVSAERASSEGHCLLLGSALLKHIAPLNKSIVRLLRKPWGWVNARGPGEVEPRRGTGDWERRLQSLPAPSRMGLVLEGGCGYLHTLRDAQKLGSESLLQMR